MAKIKKDDHLYLIDGSSYIFRAYHALPPLTRKSDGLPVGAVAGFCNMLYKLLKETKGGDKPSHLAVIFDHSAKTFRNEIYPEYKAHRPDPPEDLIPQFGLIREAVRAFNVPCIEQENYEADDLIATYARQAEKAGAKVTIVSSDKDLMQLVSDTVELYDTMKDRRSGPDEVREKFGVGPDRVIDVQALAGDSVDNVPGVPGIGVKTAAQLIEEYGDLETLLARAEEIKQPKRRENLISFADQARISKRLVTLDDAVPVEVTLDDFAVTDIEARDLIPFLKAMEFNTLTRRIAKDHEVEDLDAFDATDVAVDWQPDEIADTADTDGSKASSGAAPSGSDGGAPGAIRDLEKIKTPIDTSAYEIITDMKQLEAWIARAYEQGEIAFDTETTSLDSMQAGLVGLSLALAPGEACYIPLNHGKGEGFDFDGEETVKQLDEKTVLKKLKPLLEDPSVLKIAQNLKYDFVVLARRGIHVTPFDDTMLISYALDAGLNGHGMDELAEKHLGHTPIPFKEIAGSGKKQITFDQVPVEKAAAYAGEDADVTLRLHRLLKPRLAADGMTTVYETLERPLAPVIADMEMAGVKVDRTILARMSKTFADRMAELEAKAHEQAGESFNLGSPKQLGEILFGKLGMKTERAQKTRTGAQATGADVLEELAAQGHDLPQTILDWRQVSKLKSTYTDALPGYIHPETGRVHTSFSLAATSTGRLSSSDPNVQNIPIRTAEGREIRTAFIAEKGNVLIAADYSQIELRLLAHIADIGELREAFERGEDIHARTASEIFGVPIEGMDPMVRRKAKAINFGIIYGISAFGLGNQLKIPRGEAQSYIDAYFKRFPGIRDYMDRTRAFCRKHGYVETVFGRRAHMPNINAKQPAMRAFMERAAINAPIQGSAADIIRRAMIRLPDALAAKKLTARMLLQVHDELIFEAPEKEADTVIKMAKEVMEKAALPALELSVPLVVDANAGKSWAEAH